MHICITWPQSCPTGAVYMHQWTGSSFVQVMAWRPFGAYPSPEPMLPYCQWDSWEHISVKFSSELYHFHSRKCIWKCRLPKMAAILFRGRWVNMRWSMRCPITYYVAAPTSVINFLIIYRHSIIMYIPKPNHISWLSGEWLGHNEAWNRHCMQGSMGDGNWSLAWTFVMVINSGNSHCCDSVRAIIVLIL